MTPFNLKILLQCLLIALLAWNLLFCVRWVLASHDHLRNWTHHDAEIVRLAAEPDEFSVIRIARRAVEGVPGIRFADPRDWPDDADSRHILLPRNWDAWFSGAGAATVLQDPSRPARLELLSGWGIASPLLARLFVIALLLAGWQLLRDQPWGENQTWQHGGWRADGGEPAAAGAAGAAGGVLRSDPRPLKFVALMPLVVGALALHALAGVLIARTAIACLQAGAFTFLFALLAHWFVGAWSLQVEWNDDGIVSRDWFGARRVAWAEVGDIRYRNDAAAQQATFDRGSRTGSRPPSDPVYVLLDREGREMLSLAAGMQPAAQLDALVALARARSTLDTPAEDSIREIVERRAARQARDTADVAAASASHGPRDDSAIAAPSGWPDGVRLALLVLALPFAWLLASTGWRAAHYQFGAELAEARVIATAEADGAGRALEFRTADGQLQRIAFTGENADPGATLMVRYLPDRPELARADAFLSIWGSTLAVALFCVPMILICLFGLPRAWPAPGPR